MFGIPKQAPLIHSNPQARKLVQTVGSISAALLLFTLSLLFIGVWRDRPVCFNLPLQLLGVVWAIFPPLWFWFEYFFLWDRAQLEHFKHGQALSGAIWLGTLALIAAYLKLV